MAMDLVVRVTEIAGLTVLQLSGEADLATLPRLSDTLTRALATASGAVVVDLDGVHVLDDAGLGLLLGAAGRARQAGSDLTVVCSQPALRERLAITGFDRAVAVVASVAQVTRNVGS